MAKKWNFMYNLPQFKRNTLNRLEQPHRSRITKSSKLSGMRITAASPEKEPQPRNWVKAQQKWNGSRGKKLQTSIINP